MRRLRWDLPSTTTRPLPKHPYRDSVLIYGALAVLVVVVAVATGGGLGKAVLLAGVAFVLATLWSWRTWRNRLREERARQADERQ